MQFFIVFHFLHSIKIPVYPLIITFYATAAVVKQSAIVYTISIKNVTKTNVNRCTAFEP